MVRQSTRMKSACAHLGKGSLRWEFRVVLVAAIIIRSKTFNGPMVVNPRMIRACTHLGKGSFVGSFGLYMLLLPSLSDPKHSMAPWSSIHTYDQACTHLGKGSFVEFRFVLVALTMTIRSKTFNTSRSVNPRMIIACTHLGKGSFVGSFGLYLLL